MVGAWGMRRLLGGSGTIARSVDASAAQVHPRLMSEYSKSLFNAPHVRGNPIQPDLTRLPKQMRDALHIPDPIRDNEACGHMQTHKPPMSVPGARVRFYILEEEHRAPRLSMKIVDPNGGDVLAQISFDVDQSIIAHEAFSAMLASPIIAALLPRTAPAPDPEELVPAPQRAPGEVPPPFNVPVG